MAKQIEERLRFQLGLSLVDLFICVHAQEADRERVCNVFCEEMRLKSAVAKRTETRSCPTTKNRFVF